MKNMNELVEVLNNASKAYYGGNPVMSDHEWDKMFDELKALEEKTGIALPNSPTQKAGAEVVTSLKKVKHEQPALSLAKVKYANRIDLLKWFGRPQAAVVSWKCDGLTVVLTYDNGKLVQAATRGNGEEGSVITHNAKFFKGVPEKIAYDGHLVVRGEAMMTFEEFERVNAAEGGIYENPRNLAAATIQMLDANESRKRQIIFKAFELVTPEPQPSFVITGNGGKLNLMFTGDRLNYLETLGFDVVEKEYVNADSVLNTIEYLKDKVEDLPFPTDGLVITYNDAVYGMKLGHTGHHFRHSVALKWTDETAETTITDIEWSVGRTGLITPVAVFNPVRLGVGSTITRASLHNLSIMENMPYMGREGETCTCGKGSKVKVYLANMIIPQIAESTPFESYLYDANEKYDSRSERCRACADWYSQQTTGCPCVNGTCDCCDPKSFIPETCPVCGADTRIENNNGVKTLHCDNPHCGAKMVGSLLNATSKDGLFVKGLGESQIEDLIEENLLSCGLYSLFTLKKDIDAGEKEIVSAKDELLNKDGWGETKFQNLLDAIEEARNTDLKRFIYSLNIPLIGVDMSKKLSKFFDDDAEEFIGFVHDVREHFNTSVKQLLDVEGLGEEKAVKIAEWCDMDLQDFLTLKALVNQLNFKAPAIAGTDTSLEGLTFVITGTVNEYKNRDEFKASVEARGGKVAGSVSAKTSFLVNNDVTSTSGKNQKAKELNIPIISENDFIEKFGK